MSPRLPQIIAAAVAVAASGAAQIQIQLGGAVAVKPAGEQSPGDAEDDIGRRVEMFENTNLDLYLRKANGFLAAQKWQDAILILQDVVEGRTITASLTGEPATGPDAQPGSDQPKDDGKEKEKEKEKAGNEKGEVSAKTVRAAPAKEGEAKPVPANPGENDPALAMFSSDGRLYRPVRRLCHEMLTAMPPEGMEIYGAHFEVAAEELLAAANRSGLTVDYEKVSNRYFLTQAAGRSMATVADRLMHEGRYRAAVQTLRDLLDVYPPALRRRLGLSDQWLHFKLALCLRLAGEQGEARDYATQLAERFKDESLRIAGELQPMAELPSSPVFAADDAVVAIQRSAVSVRALPQYGPLALAALWEFRFTDQLPYREAPRENRNQYWGGEGMTVNAAPFATKYGTGTSALLHGDPEARAQIVFMDNFRLRLADACTGVQLRQGDGSLEQARPRGDQPRVRVPAYDLANMRVIDDAERWYALLGYQHSSASGTDAPALRDNEIVAYDRRDLSRKWSTRDWPAGEAGFKGVTFLAAPTPFGERLLVPVLRKDAYSLQCLDRRTGAPQWCTRIHAGGSEFIKAPGCSVHVIAGTAYVMTNAGCLAAIDAFAGDVRWIRRYERLHPNRERPRRRKVGNEGMHYMMQFMEKDLPSFLPSDVIAHEGLLIFGACDSETLLCVDGANGQLVWVLDAMGRNAPYGRMHYLIGATADHLYVATEQAVLCVGLRSGRRLWYRDLPTADATLTRWRGRGIVLDGNVVMPGLRELHVLPGDGSGDFARFTLPSFGLSVEPQHGPNNLFSFGPYLAVCYASGIEVYSTTAALRALAEANPDPLRKATLLAQAADLRGAIDTLAAWIRRPEATAAERRDGGKRMVGLAAELATELSRSGKTAEAAQVLAGIEELMVERDARLDWFIARLDLCRQLNDLRAYEAEQQRLYRYMEGRN